MDNKKLLNFLINDLSELDELFAEKSNNSFDTLEMDFLRTRVKGAKKLVQILIEREKPVDEEILENMEKTEPVKEIAKVEVEEEKVLLKEEIISVEKTEEKEIRVEETKEVIEPVRKEIIEPVKKEVVEEVNAPEKKELEKSRQEELELEEEDVVEHPNRRLGDSFLKEKSVNDLLAGDSGKLEHKLSNRPVASIQTSIGINDRFQYIRELFEGSADDFAKTVAELDNMSNLKEAVSFLQQNFKWKKNDTSLKFVHLVKRRFLNE